MTIHTLKEQLKRFIFRKLGGNDTLKSIFGRRAVEWFKNIISVDGLFQVGSVDSLFSVKRSFDFNLEGPIHITFDVLQDNVVHETVFRSVSEGTYRVPSPRALHLEECLVGPRGNVILNSERTIAKESSNLGDSASSITSAHAVDRKSLCFEKIRRIEGPATLLRAPGRGYYHAQVDNLPRLTLLHHPHFSSLEEIKLLRPKRGPAVNYELEDYYIPRLAPSNCRIVELDNDALHAVKDYIFLPFLTRKGVPYIPRPFLDQIRASLLPDRASKRCERIYISRDKASRRRVTNEGELMDTLAPCGFKKYFLEDLHIEEKVELFYDAECVISPHGAGLTSILFCKEATVFELFPTKVLDVEFYIICQSLGLDYHFWKPDVERDRIADFPVDVAEIKATLDEEIGLQETFA